MTNPARYRLAASVLIRDAEGRILIVGEADPRVSGKINLPGGHVEPGEEVTACAVRECLEETGLAPVLSGVLGVYISDGGVNVVFLGTTDQTHTTPGNDILECSWLFPASIEGMPDDRFLRPRKLRRMVAEAQSGLSHPLDVVKTLEPENLERG